MALAACSSTGSGGSSSSSRTASEAREEAESSPFTLTCLKGMGQCHEQARELCGSAGYQVVKGPGTSGFTNTTGQLDDRAEGASNSRGLRIENYNLTVVCNKRQ